MVEIDQVVYIGLELVIAFLAVAGNVLVCWAVCLNSNLQSITNFFVVSLALADIAVGLLAIPLAIVISTGFCADFHGCLFIACFVLMLTQSSIFSLLAIAADRYTAIKRPLRYTSLVTRQRAKGIIAVCWVFSVGIGSTPMLGWNKGENSKNSNSSCPDGMTKCLFEGMVTLDYMVYFNFFGCVLVPLLVMLALYTRIFMAARHQLRQMQLKLAHGPLSTRTSSTLRKEVHAAKSLAVIVGLFALCWLPLHIINFYNLLCQNRNRPGTWVMNMAIILSHANSAVNPFIYAFRIQEFRHTFHKILYRHLFWQRNGHGIGAGNNGGRGATTLLPGYSLVDQTIAPSQGYQMGTSLHCCFVKQPMTPREGSTTEPVSWNYPVSLAGLATTHLCPASPPPGKFCRRSLLLSQSHRDAVSPCLRISATSFLQAAPLTPRTLRSSPE
ncbi:adenosine receptor A2a-like [Lampris incognitus]|uniref:adenosine receptor A2a-like n=1 Tax=Lampris incognitus TaxID=2546036 RepID=UPI0024B52363|nr:adenosine receptor A2a-like [Lampris incognitus]